MDINNILAATKGRRLRRYESMGTSITTFTVAEVHDEGDYIRFRGAPRGTMAIPTQFLPRLLSTGNASWFHEIYNSGELAITKWWLM